VSRTSSDEPNLQVATIQSLGKVMKGWDLESGSGLWTPEQQDVQPDLPPLQLGRSARSRPVV
jgi:hypothetical protein